MDVEGAVRQFMRAAGQETTEGFATGFSKFKDLRIALLDEEFTELVEAINWADPVHVAKELADLVYVAVGACVAFGIPFNLVFAALHNSNMSKFEDEPEVRSDGKILQGKNFKPAEDAIREILG